MDEPDLDARLHGTADHADHPVAGRHLGEVVREPLDGPDDGPGAGPLAGLLDLARRRPVLVAVGAGVAAFLLTRLIKRAVRH
jgi:hypothetical protein